MPGRSKGRKAELSLETFEGKLGVLDFGPVLNWICHYSVLQHLLHSLSPCQPPSTLLTRSLPFYISKVHLGCVVRTRVRENDSATPHILLVSEKLSQPPGRAWDNLPPTPQSLRLLIVTLTSIPRLIQLTNPANTQQKCRPNRNHHPENPIIRPLSLLPLGNTNRHHRIRLINRIHDSQIRQQDRKFEDLPESEIAVLLEEESLQGEDGDGPGSEDRDEMSGKGGRGLAGQSAGNAHFEVSRVVEEAEVDC